MAGVGVLACDRTPLTARPVIHLLKDQKIAKSGENGFLILLYFQPGYGGQIKLIDILEFIAPCNDR